MLSFFKENNRSFKVGTFIFIFLISAVLLNPLPLFADPTPTVPVTAGGATQTVVGQQGTTCALFSSSGKYCMLAPLGSLFPDGQVDIKNGGLSDYLNTLYKLGVALATGLALIYITIGGVEYASTDAIQGKSDGRTRITNALAGLLLVLSSYVILGVINPQFLQSDLVLQNTNTGVGATTLSAIITDSSGNSITQPLPSGVAVDGTRNTAAGNAILSSAEQSLGSSSCSLDGNGGHLACAAVVNQIVENATGAKIVDSLSTTDMYNTLKTSGKFSVVSGNVNQALPGDIIISPTQGNNTGHVGIIETAGGGSIISNSSSDATVERNFTMDKWVNYYNTNKGLPVYIFRPI